MTIAALRSCHLRVFLPFPAPLCSHIRASSAVSETALIPAPTARPNLAPCFGLDELVAQWNKPVCLLHKPVFQAYMLWGLYTAFQKKKRGKKVISAAVWIRKGRQKAEWIILTRFRMCCRWPGFCKAIKARNLKGVYWML